EFLARHSPVVGQKPPKPNETHAVNNVPQVDLSLCVSFPSQRKHCIWPSFDSATDQPREMNAQKWKPRIRPRIDQIPNQVLTLLSDLIVRAPKGHDPRLAPFASHL